MGGDLGTGDDAETSDDGRDGGEVLGKDDEAKGVEAEKEEEQEKRRRQRLHQEGRQRNRWKKVGKAAVQGAQPTERARALVLARERSRVQRAEQGQLLLEAADRGVEGVRLRDGY